MIPYAFLHPETHVAHACEDESGSLLTDLSFIHILDIRLMC